MPAVLLKFVGGPRYDGLEGWFQRGAGHGFGELSAQALVANTFQIGLLALNRRFKLFCVGNTAVEASFEFDGLDETLSVFANAQRHAHIAESEVGRIVIGGCQDLLRPLKLRLRQHGMADKPAEIILGQGQLEFELAVRGHLVPYCPTWL